MNATPRKPIWVKMIIIAVLLVLALSFQPVPAAQAGTYTVTRTDDPLPGPCFSNDCSLREAVIEANSNPGADTIILSGGIYNLTISGSDDVAATGDLDITDDLTIKGAGPEITVVSAAGLTPSDRVFHLPSGLTPASTAVTIQNLTIQDGNASSGNDDGGGILNRGQLILSQVVIRDNIAINGGGIFSDDGSFLLMRDCVLDNNTALTSGSSGGFGGGVFNYGEARLVNAAVIHNLAQDSGGGIHNDISVSSTGAPFMNLTNVTISSNAANNNGGGISNWSAMDLLNVTIAQNDISSSSGGGGFYDSGLAGATFHNTLLDRNSDSGDDANCQTSGLSSSNGHNISSDNSCTSILTESSDQNGTVLFLGVLQHNGGPTPTMALPAISLAIDGGDGIACPATDQRGVNRPRGSNCDIGAYERIPTPGLLSCFQPDTTFERVISNTDIPEGSASGVISSITISGAGTYLWDINLSTSVDHDWNEDLDIYLFAPDGSFSKITTDNGDDFFNLFAFGTVWDDQALGPVTDNQAYFNDGVMVGPLVPEGTMGHFIGQNPNGQWELQVIDDEDHGSGDEGKLIEWSIGLATLPSAPTLTTLTESSSVSLPIPNPGTVEATIQVADAAGLIADLDVTTHIQHSFNNDLDIRLISPAGTEVTLTTDNGQAYDNVFDGTVWDDQTTGLVPLTVADYAGFANNTTASPLVPEGALAAFNGENPNGTWTLSVTDDFSTDSGSLNGWELSMKLIPCTEHFLPALVKNK